MAVRGTRRQRRTLLTVHVVSSVGWLGVSLAMLTLALFGRFSHGRRGIEGAYWTAHVFVDVLVIPFALLSLTTGVWLSLVTHWGLTRHTWVFVKLVLTVVTTGLSAFALRPTVMTAFRESGPRGNLAALHDAGTGLIAAGVVSSSTYLFMTVISTFKPWKLTPWTRQPRGRQANPRPQ